MYTKIMRFAYNKIRKKRKTKNVSLWVENNLEVAWLGTVDRVGMPSFCNDSIHRNVSWRFPFGSCRVIKPNWLGMKTFCNDSIQRNESWRSLMFRTSRSPMGWLVTLGLCNDSSHCNESWQLYKNAEIFLSLF